MLNSKHALIIAAKERKHGARVSSLIFQSAIRHDSVDCRPVESAQVFSYPFLASRSVPNARLRASLTPDFPFHTYNSAFDWRLSASAKEKKNVINLHARNCVAAYNARSPSARIAKYRTRYFRSRLPINCFRNYRDEVRHCAKSLYEDNEQTALRMPQIIDVIEITRFEQDTVRKKKETTFARETKRNK